MILPVLKKQMLCKNWTEETVQILRFPHWNLWLFVFVYQYIRHPGTWILRPSYQYLFINIAHAMSICNFARSCICVFVYLCICICVFARHALKNIDFEILAPLHFHNYSTCHVHLHHALKQIQSKEMGNPITWGGADALRKLPIDFPGLKSVQICKTKPAVCSNIISEYRETIKNVWEASY